MSLKSKTYGIFCTKGGVGKTTQGANLGAILADMKQRVLLIDADPQQSMSRFFELIESAPYGLSQVYGQCLTQLIVKSYIHKIFPRYHYFFTSSKRFKMRITLVKNENPKKDLLYSFHPLAGCRLLLTIY